MPTNGTYVDPYSPTNSSILSFINAVYQNYFHQLSVGWYTVEAEDLWNQTTFAYFQVVP